MEPTLSPSLFAILSDLVEERTGMHYEPRDRELFASKLLARAVDAGFESPLDYYYFLRYDDADRREFDALIDALVVGETYFFREVAPLRTLYDEVLRPAIQGGRRPRVWCAAASTGEEPLTLAMLLAAERRLRDVDIVASDISLRALARAREGAYGPRSFRAISPADRARWFEGTQDAAVPLRELRDAIQWRRVNLLDPIAVRALGAFDAVVCRNVLIYFSEGTVRGVVDTLAGALNDGGALLVGVSESLLRFGTRLQCEEWSGSFFYRKVSA
jgi:chemotaxis protein methyltransferase CheR